MIDETDDVKKILEAITEDLSEEEKEQAKLVAEYIKFLYGGKDYEGTQTFFAEDYSRRN
jgi:GTP cyclohydrolase I